MIENVLVGIVGRKSSLVLTPELYDEVKRVSSQSWGALIKLRGYPIVKNWVSISGIIGPPMDTKSFEVGLIQLFIPTKQLSVFDGKIIGYNTCIPGFRLLGFMDDA